MGDTNEAEVSSTSNRRRWPNTAEQTRQDVIELASDARGILGQARKAFERGEVAKVEVYHADAQAALADIQRLMVEAKIGK